MSQNGGNHFCPLSGSGCLFLASSEVATKWRKAIIITIMLEDTASPRFRLLALWIHKSSFPFHIDYDFVMSISQALVRPAAGNYEICRLRNHIFPILFLLSFLLSVLFRRSVNQTRKATCVEKIDLMLTNTKKTTSMLRKNRWVEAIKVFVFGRVVGNFIRDWWEKTKLAKFFWVQLKNMNYVYYWVSSFSENFRYFFWKFQYFLGKLNFMDFLIRIFLKFYSENLKNFNWTDFWWLKSFFYETFWKFVEFSFLIGYTRELFKGAVFVVQFK